MAIRLVATDLDDTLLRNDHTISRRNVEAIRKARAKGVYFTFATGRMPISAAPYVDELGLDLPIIAYNGAMILVTGSDEILFRNVIPAPTAREVVSWLLGQNMHLQIYRKNQVFTQKLNEYSTSYGRAVRVQVEETDLLELTARETEGLEKIIVFGEPDELANWSARIAALFPGQVHLTRSKPHFIEMIHPEVNKGTALAALAQYLKVDPSEVMAIGDNLNDLEMIRYAGLGVAIGNARRELKEAADHVTASNQEDGVALVLETFVL